VARTNDPKLTSTLVVGKPFRGGPGAGDERAGAFARLMMGVGEFSSAPNLDRPARGFIP